MELLIPEFDGMADRVGALSTLRRGGFSIGPYGDGQGGGGLNLGVHVGDEPAHVAHNRALLRRLLPSEPAWLTQVHGADVLDAAQVKEAPQADASVATQAGIVCVVQTADCLPVLFCDTQGKAVAAAHAGWRGLAGGVLENTVARMRAAGALDILAWLGPAIGPQRFEVGAEVRDAFLIHNAAHAAAFHPIAGQPGKYLADIYLLARTALAAAGVQHISGGDHCTVTESASFYSYRRDKTTGRMASLIWLKQG
jgi:YfiH family protein